MYLTDKILNLFQKLIFIAAPGFSSANRNIWD